MDRGKNKRLMMFADEILSDSGNCPLYKEDKKTIHDSYNGQVAALGVSVLMIGLKPTLSVYYQDSQSKKDKAYRRAVLEVIAQMLTKDNNTLTFSDAEGLVRFVLSSNAEDLKTPILDCSVALKQVIRTYNLG